MYILLLKNAQPEAKGKASIPFTFFQNVDFKNKVISFLCKMNYIENKTELLNGV